MSKNENKNGNCQLSFVFIPKSKDPLSEEKKTKQIETKLKINNNKLSKSFLMEVTLNEPKCWFHDAKAERELYIALQSVKLKFTSENSNCNECSKL